MEKLSNFLLTRKRHRSLNAAPLTQIYNKSFFIFGCPRSGSSLLSRILNQHSQIAIPYESQIFRYFLPWIHFYGDLNENSNLDRLIGDILSTDFLSDWQPTPRKKDVINFVTVNNLGGVFDAIMLSWANLYNKTTWGEKSPRHTFLWKEILSFFPSTKFIYIVRDGRDVALSSIKARFGPKTIYAAAKEWHYYIQTINRIKDNVSPTQYFTIKYENLVSEPENTLDRLCKFLGFSFEPKMLNFYENQSDYKSDIVNLKNLKKPLIANNLNKWKKSLSAKELIIFESIARKSLIDYGYTPYSSKTIELTPFKEYYLRYIEHPFNKIIAMSKNRKGHKNWLIQFRIVFRLLYDYYI